MKSVPRLRKKGPEEGAIKGLRAVFIQGITPYTIDTLTFNKV